MNRCRTVGFTLVEVLLAVLTLSIAFAALLGAFLSQITLNEHARNLSLAVHDANRVIEQIRQDTIGCTLAFPEIDPSNNPTDPAASWDAWLEAQAQGKSIPNADGNAGELIVVTCQDEGATVYCPATQMGAEWHAAGAAVTRDPLRITVTACWRHRQRVIGECSWDGIALTASDADSDSVIESPASLTTLVTCRG